MSKTYNTPGSYDVRLTVTDNKGATGTKTVAITVMPNPSTVLRVQSIAMSVQVVSMSQTVTAKVVVSSLNGLSVSNVNVKGNWTGVYGGPDSAITDATGTATIVSAATKKHGSEMFTVSGLTRSGFKYDATKNLVVSGTIIVP